MNRYCILLTLVVSLPLSAQDTTFLDGPVPLSGFLSSTTAGRLRPNLKDGQRLDLLFPAAMPEADRENVTKQLFMQRTRKRFWE